ncbi:MAG TPA: 16S rRNA (uracil(1498)-N(3))-methyltransferase [Candidatus Methylomirabilis sp.]|nr:16S rRNA (uracil(1498)-N(3))-methyltransferase [Candidatus Methylomirabilis sp.]
MRDTRIHHRRFFVLAEHIRDGWVEFVPGQARQMTQVLRLRPGDEVAIFDGTGREIVAALTTASPRRARARILREMPRTAPPVLSVTLAQVMPRGGAMDLVVGKATELGVSRIVPLEAERSVRRGIARDPRWRRIVQEAAEQCGRTDLPELTPPLPLEAFLRGHPQGVPLVACDPVEGSRPLVLVCQDLRNSTRLTLLVGGEGGFSPSELERLRVHGARLASLGPRLLRAETAALAALTIVQAILGDWGPGEGNWAGTRTVPGGGERVPA